MRAVVITGVSTGIGYATAKLFASRNIKVFGSVRSDSDAVRLQQELGANFSPLLFDVTDKHKIQVAAQFVRQEMQGNTLWGLINNAGIAVSGALLNMPLDDLQKQLDVNLFGQLKVIQAFAPLLGADQTLSGEPGRIINISSVAGKVVYPFMGPYSISKFAFEALSEGLRRELMIFGIDVIIVGPGTIATNIWDKAEQQPMPADMDTSVYNESGHKFKNFMLENARKHNLPAEDVAKLLLHILETKHPKIRYAIVPSKFLNWTLPNLLPKRWIDKLIAQKFGLTRNK